MQKNNRFLLIGTLFLIYILFETVMRIVFMTTVWNELPLSLTSFIKTFLLGFLFDVTVFLQGVLPFMIFLILSPARWFSKKWFQYLIMFLVTLHVFLFAFIEVSEYLFWDEFLTSFNFIAVDYLVYTHEVIGNIWQSYPIIKILLTLFLLSLFIIWYFRKFFVFNNVQELSSTKKIILSFLILIFPVFTFYGIDPSYKLWVSDNNFYMEISGNGIYNFFSAYRNNELDYKQFYATNPDDEVMKRLKKLLKTPEATYTSENPFNVTRQIINDDPAVPEPNYNLIWITVESLSADFLTHFGNTNNITPNLDRLAKEGMLFTRLYATGTRTVRGLEAINLSLPPTPGQSIVRRPENEHMFTLGSVLTDHDYHSQFIYGGYGYFDNMNDFFHDNNYEIIDRLNIDQEKIFFENVWGVADEIMFNRSIEEIDKYHAQGKKVFQMITTTSNHRPFTYPDNRIDIPSPGGRKGAVKYTDWAIGNFIEQAKQKPWFNNSIFVIIADHQSSSAGKTSIPVQRYHIPMIVYAPQTIKPQIVDKLMSQIDAAPTVLALMKMSYQSNFLGYNIFNTTKEQERIFISTYQSLGYISRDKIVVLQPKKQIATFKILNYSTGHYQKIEEDKELTNDAIAWYQGASYLFDHQLYKDIIDGDINSD